MKENDTIYVVVEEKCYFDNVTIELYSAYSKEEDANFMVEELKTHNDEENVKYYILTTKFKDKYDKYAGPGYGDFLSWDR